MNENEFREYTRRKEYVIRAIKNLREKYPDGTIRHWGIHSVFSSFNNAFRHYFNDDPVDTINQLEADGVIEVRRANKGVLIYLKGEAPPKPDIKEINVQILGDEGEI